MPPEETTSTEETGSMEETSSTEETTSTEESTEETSSTEETTSTEEESKEGGKEESEKESSDGKDEDKEETKEGAPEQYEDFKLPEGFEVDDSRVEGLREYGREHDLSQGDVQALVDLHVEATENLLKMQQEQWAEVKKGWEADVKNDKTFHDEKGNADAAIAGARKAAELLGGEELVEAMDVTGAGSHPAVVKAFHVLSKHIEEDRLVLGGSVVDGRTAEQKLYPTMKK